VLDIGTGGGEALLTFADILPGDTVATEGWAPTVPVARAALESRGIPVVSYDPEAPEATDPKARAMPERGDCLGQQSLVAMQGSGQDTGEQTDPGGCSSGRGQGGQWLWRGPLQSVADGEGRESARLGSACPLDEGRAVCPGAMARVARCRCPSLSPPPVELCRTAGRSSGERVLEQSTQLG